MYVMGSSVCVNLIMITFVLFVCSVIFLVLRIFYDSSFISDEFHLYVSRESNDAIESHILNWDSDSKTTKLIESPALPHRQDCHFTL